VHRATSSEGRREAIPGLSPSLGWSLAILGLSWLADMSLQLVTFTFPWLSFPLCVYVPVFFSYKDTGH
jgi:hypothetical protein